MTEDLDAYSSTVVGRLELLPFIEEMATTIASNVGMHLTGRDSRQQQ